LKANKSYEGGKTERGKAFHILETEGMKDFLWMDILESGMVTEWGCLEDDPRVMRPIGWGSRDGMRDCSSTEHRLWKYL
jgi:hypothetical protein